MQNRLPVIFILITVMIDAMGIGLMMPVMPDLIQDIQGADLGHAAIWGGILATSFAVMQFLFGPMLGNLSDRYGRRPVLLVAQFVMTGDGGGRVDLVAAGWPPRWRHHGGHPVNRRGLYGRHIQA